MQHKELGRDLLQKIYQPIEDIAAMESTPKVRGISSYNFIIYFFYSYFYFLFWFSVESLFFLVFLFFVMFCILFFSFQKLSKMNCDCQIMSLIVTSQINPPISLDLFSLLLISPHLSISVLIISSRFFSRNWFHRWKDVQWPCW